MGHPATAFATIVNGGNTTATACTIAPLTRVPATFSYQTVDPATNLPTGTPNTPVPIPAGGAQSFLIAFTPTAAFTTTDVHLSFDCTDTDPATIIPAVNTLRLLAADQPIADMLMVVATASNDGIVSLPGPEGIGAFAVAAKNIGAPARDVTIGANDLNFHSTKPIVGLVCRTDPSTALCLTPLTPSLVMDIDANETVTVSVFVQSEGVIPLAPARNRIEAYFFGICTGVFQFVCPILGSGSVAVRTVP